MEGKNGEGRRGGEGRMMGGGGKGSSGGEGRMMGRSVEERFQSGKRNDDGDKGVD